MREKIDLNATTLGAQGVQGVVIMGNGTSGYASGDFWEWLQSKMESQYND